MKFDYVIIGSGPAGSVLAWHLSKLNFKIALIDRSNSKKKIVNDFFLPYVNKCPNYYTPVFSDQLGGNSALWHNKIYLISKKEFKMKDWSVNYDELLLHSRDLSSKFNITNSNNLEKIESYNRSDFELHYSERCKIGNIFDFLKIKEIQNIEVMENSSPIKVNFDNNLKADSVIVRDQNNKIDIKININRSLIFCAGGIGNAHLIQNLIPIKNNIVGKFLSDHPHVNIAKIDSKQVDYYKRILKPNIKNNISNISEKERNEEAAIVYKYYETIGAVQLDYKKDPMRYLRRLFLKIPSNIIRKLLYIFGFFMTKMNGLLSKIGIIYGNYYKYSFEFFFSQSQEKNNKIFLDEKITDKFGLKKANIKWQISNQDEKNYNDIIDLVIKENNVETKDRFKNDFANNFYRSGLSGLHPSCTTRMGKDNKDSVVDGNLKIHEIKNVYVCGSSVFPVNGITNPTWTIMTLANRLAKHLAKVD